MYDYILIKHKTEVKLQAAFRMAFVITLSVFLYSYFNIQEGYWILITTGFLYIGTSINGDVIGRTKGRIIGAPLGILASAALMALLSWYDFRFTYIILIFYPIAFYAFFFTGRYFFFAFFIMFVFTMFDNFVVPPSGYINWGNLIFSRILCTFIGCLIITISECLIFPHSTSVKKSLPNISNKVLKKLSMTLLSVGWLYTKNSGYKKQHYQLHHSNVLEEIKIMKQVCNAAKAEVMHRCEDDKYFDNFMEMFHDILDSIRQLVFINNNYDSITDKHNEGIMKYTEYLSRVLLQSFDYTVPPDTKEEYNTIFYLLDKNALSAKDSIIIDSLFKLGIQINFLIENIINITKPFRGTSN